MSNAQAYLQNDMYTYMSSVKLVARLNLEYTGPPIPQREQWELTRAHEWQYIEFHCLLQTSLDGDHFRYFCVNDLRVHLFVEKHWSELARPLPSGIPFEIKGLSSLVSFSKCIEGPDIRIPEGALPAVLADPEFPTKYGLENYRTDLPLLVLPEIAFERPSCDARAVAARRKHLQECADRDEGSGSDSEPEPPAPKRKKRAPSRE